MIISDKKPLKNIKTQMFIRVILKHEINRYSPDSGSVILGWQGGTSNCAVLQKTHGKLVTFSLISLGKSKILQNASPKASLIG